MRELNAAGGLQGRPIEGALDYVRRQLEAGLALARAVAIHLHEGHIVQIVPWKGEQTNLLDARDDFTSGRPRPLVPDQDGAHPPAVRTPNSDDLLARRVHTFLQASPDRVCVLENASARAGDPFLARVHTRLAYHLGEVYHVVVASADLFEIADAVREARTAPALVLVLATYPPARLGSALLGSDLDDRFLSELAARVEEVIVGVYDGEGFVVWARQPGSCRGTSSRRRSPQCRARTP